MPIPILLTLVGRVSILKVAQFAVQKGLPKAIKKYGDDAAKKAGQWAIKNAKKVVQIKTKTKTVDVKVAPRFHLKHKTGEYVKRGTEKIEVGKKGAKSVKTVLKKKEKIVGHVGKRGTTIKLKEHRIAKVKKTTSTITVGGKKIGEVSATSRPVVRYKQVSRIGKKTAEGKYKRPKQRIGTEAEIRHQQLLNKITRFGTIKKVKGKKGKRRK